MNYENIAVLIPAYKPDRRLNQLVDDLLNAGFGNLVVVDDGGQEPYREIFNDLEGKATVLVHEVNRGKGAALKTGLAHIMQTSGIGVVIAMCVNWLLPRERLVRWLEWLHLRRKKLL